MDLSIEFQIPDTPLFRGQGARIVGEEMARATEWGVNALQAAVVPGTPTNLGILRAGWQTKVELTGDPASGLVLGRVFNPLGYALAVEGGARPHWPPLAPLIQWARRKFSASDKEARTIGFLVARKISRQGTKAIGMAKRAMAANRERIKARYSEALARAKARLVSR